MTISLILSLSLSSVFLFPLMSQPLSLGLAVMVSTLFMCTMTAMYISSWYGFILFLIYVGGLLVMFAYVATLSPNTLFGSAAAPLLLGGGQALLCPLLFFSQFSHFHSLEEKVGNKGSLTLLKSCGVELVSPMMMTILISLALILLVNLIVVVKICFYQQSALRPYKVK